VADFDVEFDLKLQEIEQRLGLLQKQVTQMAISGAASITKNAARRARRLTPRSDFSGDHIADGWTVKRIEGSRMVVFRVLNTSKSGNRQIMTKGGTTSILRIMEFGSRRHEILPKRGQRPAGGKLRGKARMVPGDRPTSRGRRKHGGSKVLVFYWARFGRMVYARRVSHPGTRPHAMIRIATTEAKHSLANLLKAIRAVIASGGRAPRIPVVR